MCSFSGTTVLVYILLLLIRWFQKDSPLSNKTKIENYYTMSAYYAELNVIYIYCPNIENDYAIARLN